MDERPPRQPDSSEPPEDSADTGGEARPPNPYRIPQRPPESEREETGGPGFGRPAQQDEDPATQAWDNPFRSGATAGTESGRETPWGAPVPGGGSPSGTSSAESSASEEDWDTGTPWGAPVPGEEPPTSAFGSVGGFEESPRPDEGRGESSYAWDTGSVSGGSGTEGRGDAWDAGLSTRSGAHEEPGPGGAWDSVLDERDADEAWQAPASDTFRDTGLPGSGSSWDADTREDHRSGGTRDTRDANENWDGGPTGAAGGTSHAWSADSGAYDAVPARGEGDTWDIGTTGDAGEAWTPSESPAPDHIDAGPNATAAFAWGSTAGAGGDTSDAWDTGSAVGSTWGTDPATASEHRDEPDVHGTWGTHAIGSSLMPGADPGDDASSDGGAGDAWGPPSGAAGAWGSPEGFDARESTDARHSPPDDAWATPASETSEGAGAHGWDSTAHDDQYSGWGAPSGAWGSPEGFGAHDDAHAWGAYTRGDRGASDTWSTSGPEDGAPEARSTGHSYGEGGELWGRPGSEDPGPSTAAFGSVGRSDADDYQYGAAHGDGWGAWGSEDDESRGSGPNAAWGASPYGEGGDTGFYGDAHSEGQDWDDPYRGQPAHQGDTPYPGGPVGPPASEGYEYLYSGGARGGGRNGYDGYDGYDADHGAAPDPDPEEPRGKSRKGLLIGAVSAVLVLALAGGAIGWYVWQMPEPEEATAAFASSWEAQDYEALAETTRGDDAAEILGGIDAGLGVDAIDVNVDQPSVESGEGSASYEVTVSLTNADDWGWEGELPLVREDGEWWIDFSPEVAYPGLGEGEVLARTAVWGERGHILAADGSRLDTPEASGSLQMIAGSLGEADEDDIERLGPAYDVGDTIGVDGLQRTHEEHLAGEAATTIVMADAEEAQGEGSVEATEENTVATLDGSDGEDITTSIDPNVQNTAASAIMEADDPAGLVAVRPSSGEILAAVNVPGGFNRAFEGQYPPGSAFKLVSYSALLDSGMSTDATMACPEEYELGGWPFRNAGEAEYGSQTVTEAFATSCNTALVAELGDRVSGEQLQASAEQFGMNQPLDIGVTTHEPLFPPVDSATMLGSQGIGQGQILTSPLHMATLPAAIADGSWRHPVLVNDPEPADLPEPTQIANAEAIRPMMRAVITDGTAKDLNFQGEVFGKTGTAEFGTAEDADEDDELPSHAWMVGYKGDVAFAVVVDGGGGGSSVAGPLAESFANGLP